MKEAVCRFCWDDAVRIASQRKRLFFLLLRGRRRLDLFTHFAGSLGTTILGNHRGRFWFEAKGVCVTNSKEKGTVKWFNGAKGYGFIQRSTGEDVFVHFSVIQENGYRTLNEGEVVEFELLKGPKGLQASNVVRGNA
jgi:cold shock protein